MGFTLDTEYSLWFALICLAVAFLYAFLFYRNDDKFKDISSWKIRLMFLLRFSAVFLISFFLLSPLIKTNNKFIEKPLIILAQDNSESILHSKDSSFYKTEYRIGFEKLKNELAQKYDVVSIGFGATISDSIDFSFTDKRTNYSALFSEIESRYSNRNIGALVIASDGLYNEGVNPQYSTNNINYPLYILALGDTSSQRDIMIKEVMYNNIAFLGNKFPLQIVVHARELKNTETNVHVYDSNHELFSKKINFKSDDAFEKISLELEAEKIGLQHYYIKVDADKQETNLVNNKREIVIDVIDNRQKVLVLFNSPHPDIGAIKNALSVNLNLETEIYSLSKFDKNISDYNLIILHQIPSLTNAATTILSDILAKKIPVLFVLGGQSSFAALNNLKTGFSIGQVKTNFDESQAYVDDKFTYFDIDSDLKEFIEKASPLLAPYGDYKFSNTSSVLCKQKVKGVQTEKPLILFDSYMNNKIGFILGEGIWRWEIFSYKEYNTHELFNRLINKMAQYLALKINKNNFQLTVKKIFSENEAVIFEAEIYNESFELNNSEEIGIDIFSSDSIKYSYNFNKTTNAYRLNIGNFPAGDYSYVARTKISEKPVTAKGKFSIVPLNIEAENTVANHKILNDLAKNNMGDIFSVNEFDKLKNRILSDENIVSIEYNEKQLQDFINLKLFFFLVLALLSIEWFLRKCFGSY
ncbi:MAG TPA: hypothetical protein DDX39_09025 [Bacteroidales bacterium]|nr:MAG: hypothetical protein A2W98_06170 [Bacteroidetes bacterium GWF2_33_38]OFY74331.1 MAG: hypothetical protein A2265_09660 [Bacteroidetes bacterium RIFOXYA12_FULL_33_9]OFY88092.1 MAG: hypothetical protein A2236_06130 [Bacteroidetes bacterium RIFOXYA2_FULL_33_7]HBF88770.1 hypothetical protein [Bacteroidales bacterium]